jgi:hypothetical protein
MSKRHTKVGKRRNYLEKPLLTRDERKRREQKRRMRGTIWPQYVVDPQNTEGNLAVISKWKSRGPM